MTKIMTGGAAARYDVSMKIVVIVVLLSIFCLLTAASHACTVCHSKDPKMVRMHEALGYKDCFVCHGPAAKRSTDEPQKQMKTDERCVKCHATTAPLETRATGSK